MTASLSRRTGSALLWKSVQLVLGRGIGTVRTLLVAAIVAPETFGVLAVAVLVVEVFQSLTDLGLRHALIQRSTVDERQYDAAWTFNLLRSAAVSGGTILAAPVLARLFDQPESVGVIRLLALAPLLMALANVRTVELERDLAYRPLTLITVPTAITDAAVAVSLAGTLGAYGLVIGTLTGHAVGVVASYTVKPRRPRWRLDTEAIRPLLKYGRWVLGTGLVVVVAGAVLQATISRRLGAAELGLWYLGTRIALLPNEVVGDIVSGVAFSLYARIQHDRPRVQRVFQSSMVALLALLAPVYAVMIGVVPALVSSVLGPEWAGVTNVIYLLAVAGVVGAVADASMPLLQGLGRPRDITLMFVVRSAAIVALVWWLAGAVGLVGAALAWLIAEVAGQLTIGWQVRDELPDAFSGLPRRALPVLAAACTGGAVAAAIQVAAEGGLVGLIAGGAAGMVVGGGAVIATDRSLDLGVGRDVAAMVPALSGLLGGRRATEQQP